MSVFGTGAPSWAVQVTFREFYCGLQEIPDPEAKYFEQYQDSPRVSYSQVRHAGEKVLNMDCDCWHVTIGSVVWCFCSRMYPERRNSLSLCLQSVVYERPHPHVFP